MLDFTKYNDAILYAKYISNGQNATPVSGQQSAIKKFAFDNRIEIIDEYKERDFQQLLSDIRSEKYPEVDAILAFSNDIFPENIFSYQRCYFECKMLNIDLICVTEALMDSPEDRLLVESYELLDEYRYYFDDSSLNF